MRGKKFINSIKISNLLSYGTPGAQLDLEPLNILIGPNASGKSNLIEAVSLLAAAPRNLAQPFWKGGGVEEWIWKGPALSRQASLEVTLEHPAGVRYLLSFTEIRSRLHVVEERLEDLAGPEAEPHSYYAFRGGKARIRARSVQPSDANQRAEDRVELEIDPRELASDQSILSQRRDSHVYPELTHVSTMFGQIGLFRDWNFGRGSKARGPQPADLPNDFLLEDASNLGLVLNDLKNRPGTKRSILESLRQLYREVEDFETKIEGGRLQLFLHERDFATAVPSARLSDGTLRYLCLLAILCHPSPPPLICLEEPEIGLHPDVIPKLAELLVEAAERTQLIVTTHSEALVSSLSRLPEAVVVCDRTDSGTDLRRLQPEQLQEWLERYQLGELWSMGEIGGNRW